MDKNLQNHVIKRNYFAFRKNKAKKQDKNLKFSFLLMHLLVPLVQAYQPRFCLITKASGLTIGPAIEEIALLRGEVTIDLLKCF